MKRYFLLIISLLSIKTTYAQWPINGNYTYDFGTVVNTYSTLGGASISNADNTGFMPVPSSGSTRVSVHNDAVNGKFVLNGNQSLSIFMPTNRLIKFSNYDITSSTDVLYATCSLNFSANSGSSSGGTYTWAFGNNTSNTLFTNTGNSLYRSNGDVFAALRWTLSGTSTITFGYRQGASTSTTTNTTIDNTTFVQGNSYVVEVYCNNSGFGKSYTKNSENYILPNNMFHVWVDGVRIGSFLRSIEVDGSGSLSSGSSIALANSSPLNTYMFLGDGAATATGNLTISDIALSYNLSSEVVDPSFDTIIDNIIYSFVNGRTASSINSGVNNASPNTLTTAGAWPDLTYTTLDAFDNHITRVTAMAIGYTTSTSSYYQSDDLYKKILLALRYWIKTARPTANNWWYEQIDYPKELGKTLVFMRRGATALPQTTLDSCIAYMASREHPSVQNGANRIDEAIHWIYRGALTADDAVLQIGVEQALTTLTMVPRGTEGLTFDYSFLQHGPQILTHAYGTVWISSLYDVADWVRNTPYILSDEQKDIAFNFLHGSFYAATRGRHIDFNLAGRGVARMNNMNAPNLLVKAIRVDPAHAAILQDDNLRITGAQPANYNIATPYSKHYWQGDYSLHNRPKYSFSVRGVSTRTIRAERVNNENLLGKFNSDGATSIRVDGDEYFNIFPVWDWNKVPGITMREFATPQENNTSRVYGSTTFVGGVSDGTYGASTYLLNYVGVNARKSWFLFDDEIVCLGAGITSAEPENITTSVNQCLLNGAVTTYTSQSNILAAATQQNYANNLKWVYHNKVGYFFPEGGNVTLSNVNQTGNWRTISVSQNDAVVNADVFKMYIGHGTQPTNATYAYIVAPGLADANAAASYNTENIKIISNTTALQAVKHEISGVLQAVFVNAGTVTDVVSGIQITVDKPCAISLKNIGSDVMSITVADPAQTQNSIAVTINLTNTGKTIPLNFVLPGGNYKGSSVTQSFDKTAVAQTEKIYAIADSYVRDGNYANVNYGTENGLVVKRDGSVGFSRQTYLKFNIGTLNNFSQAVLRLYGSGNTTANTTSWNLYQTDDTSWSETSLTWNNKPVASNLLFTQTGKVEAGYTDWDITNAIKALPPGSVLSLVIISTTTGSTTDVNFSSREVTDETRRPAIVITTLTPEAELLPVNLVSFSAKAESNSTLLNWTTASELNNDKFVVERSGDGKEFIVLGEVKGKGTSNELNPYMYRDNSPLNGTNYYRLKQVDFDGKFEYSAVKSVKFSLQNKSIVIYPNPFNKSFVIAGNEKPISSISLSDISGRKLMERKNPTGEIDVPNLSIGVYFLTINYTDGQISNHKIIKNNN